MKRSCAVLDDTRPSGDHGADSAVLRKWPRSALSLLGAGTQRTITIGTIPIKKMPVEAGGGRGRVPEGSLQRGCCPGAVLRKPHAHGHATHMRLHSALRAADGMYRQPLLVDWKNIDLGTG